ncbi:hypothetical protein ACJMK2_044646 [Sinanodonta woodiana]|uniref:G-protein coupled receptors family 1 profile domain-containing protein n=1 Tax=Sinanodonta woodiana TaxID=1069815 RepID=A0ABD3W0S2_SINWO
MNVTNSNIGSNVTSESPLPTFNDVALVKTLIYGAMFFISLFGNIATLIQMYRMRRRKSTINTLIVNLATADLIVSFFCTGTEVVWNATVQWYAGEVMCKSVKFLQAFGLNLSTCITIVISLDRCFVIIDPMSRNKAPQRVKIMIAVSWAWCLIFSIPQVRFTFFPYIIFRLYNILYVSASSSFLIIIAFGCTRIVLM